MDTKSHKLGKLIKLKLKQPKCHILKMGMDLIALPQTKDKQIKD